MRNNNCDVVGGTKGRGKLEQMVLDFGQKSFGRKIECATCGLLYCRGDPDDEAAHAKHCDPWLHGVQMPATPWKKERVMLSGTVNCRHKEVQKLVGAGMARVQNGIVGCSLMGDVVTSSHGTLTSMNADAHANADRFRIIEVRSGVDPAAHLAKLSEVHAIVAADLGTESLEAEDARSLCGYETAESSDALLFRKRQKHFSSCLNEQNDGPVSQIRGC